MLWSISGEEKSELLSTCTLYALAIGMSDQLKVGVVSQVVSPSFGELRLGADGVVITVRVQEGV